jgi:hypothetical protein
LFLGEVVFGGEFRRDLGFGQCFCHNVIRVFRC